MSNITSIAEWRRTQKRLAGMTQRELAMTVFTLIDLVIELLDEVNSEKPVDS